MCVFLFSGLMHEYVIYITIHKFSGDQMKFFLLQGLAVVLEHAIKPQINTLSMPKFLSFILTFLFNGITSGYFLRPWITYFKKREILKFSLINFLIR